MKTIEGVLPLKIFSKTNILSVLMQNQLKYAYRYFIALELDGYEGCINVLAMEAGISHKNKCYDVSDNIRDYLYDLGFIITYDDKHESIWLGRKDCLEGLRYIKEG